jgi:hypothetical protein
VCVCNLSSGRRQPLPAHDLSRSGPGLCRTNAQSRVISSLSLSCTPLSLTISLFPSLSHFIPASLYHCLSLYPPTHLPTYTPIHLYTYPHIYMHIHIDPKGRGRHLCLRGKAREALELKEKGVKLKDPFVPLSLRICGMI